MPLLKKTIHESDQILKQNPLAAHFIPPAAPAEEPAEEPSAAPTEETAAAPAEEPSAAPAEETAATAPQEEPSVIFVCSFQGFTASSI